MHIDQRSQATGAFHILRAHPGGKAVGGVRLELQFDARPGIHGFVGGDLQALRLVAALIGNAQLDGIAIASIHAQRPALRHTIFFLRKIGIGNQIRGRDDDGFFSAFGIGKGDDLRRVASRGDLPGIGQHGIRKQFFRGLGRHRVE